MVELGSVIASVSNQSNRQDQTLIKQGTINTWFQLRYFRIKIRVTNILIEHQDTGGDQFVVGHPVLSVLPATVGTGAWSFATHQNITSPNGGGRLTDAGRKQFAEWLAGNAPNQPKYGAWGDSDTAYDVTQTALQSQIAMEPDAGTGASGAVGAGTITILMDPTPTAGTMKEFGLFDATSSGNMYFRQVTNPLAISVTADVRVTVTITVTDDTNMSGSAIITNNGLEHFRDFFTTGASVFTKTALSDGTTDLSVNDVQLDGLNESKKTIGSRLRKGYATEMVTVYTTSDFNGNDMGKGGYYVT